LFVYFPIFEYTTKILIKFKPLVGKYFSLDSGYTLQKGLPPIHKKVHDYTKEFDENSHPTIARRLVNLCYSSLRITIERAFGILKMILCAGCKAILGFSNTSKWCACLLRVEQFSQGLRSK